MHTFNSRLRTVAASLLLPVSLLAQPGWVEPGDPGGVAGTVYAPNDRVGINVVPGPNYRLNVNGNAFVRGQLRLDNYRNFIQFGTGLQGLPGERPMMFKFNSGTSNNDRMVIAHSPGFSNWGLQYQDVGDRWRWLRAGTSVMDIAGVIDMNTTTNFNDGVTFDDTVNFGANAEIISDVNFRDDLDSITFPAVTSTNPAPIMHQFASGTSNNDRMVIAHSPAFPTWGLQYRDVGDEYHFLGAGNTAMAIDLFGGRVSIANDNPNATGNTNVRLVVGQQTATNLVAASGFFAWSSRRFKDDIEQFDDADYDAMLDKVVDSPIFRWRYKDDSPEEARFGITVEDSQPEITGGHEDGVDMSVYVASLHAATVAQQRRIDEQAKEIAELKKAVAELLQR